ncbi:fibrinogen-binding adhesin SdrG C-terminal domain-containing protein [Staphylococcus pseudintermedius]|uniref:fibronectin-binding surface protein SpsL n=3 Tax=Staphylococcus pseudintermedius TaxID=283734 RepID=UPI0007AE5059|nr:YSIRK-type signal peptide-containing protein [Staphylococcus pseudintermedius]EGQ4388376.1 YSIRK-type signal peptide-containing protein [Staphylococcus pseudintermedius]EJA1875126.1 fibrinogen-binding adhesin SdrG C-terminal domain-containing protein [Staphylococcus pseudintermedius]EJL7991139.1 fibrinogen-binding adhesin SdrG C-terminal domain-containing protein [Staphylococcus pseudintermedius]MCE5564607.1 fibrinogen-binding adhesin SdrG C-terminal domain-containing protein [Staphylococcus
MYKNEKEKHSIRKLSIGAASVIVGGLMYGVLGNDEAQANEDVTETTGRNSVTTQASEQHLQVEAVPQEGNNVNVSAVKVPTNTATQAQEDVASVSDVKAHADDALQAQESSHTDGVSSEFKQETAYANPQTAETVKPNSEAAHQSEDEDKQKPVSFSRKEDETMLQQQQVEAKNVVSAEEVSQEENTQVMQSPQDVEQHVGGKDISNEVVVDRSDIKGFNSETTIRPHQGQGGRLNYQLKFPSNVKSGDQFTIKLSDNINTHGVSVERTAPRIMAKNTEGATDVIAEGLVLEDGKTIVYTFKDYVNGKQNLTAELSVSYFVSPEKVLTTGTQTFTTMIGNHSTQSNIYVYYDNSHYVDGRISQVNKKEAKFQQIAYINPNGYLNGRGTIAVNGEVVSGTTKDLMQPTVRVYQYKGQGVPPESITIDPNMWEEISITMVRKYDGGYSLNLDTSKNQKYAIYYEGAYDAQAETLLYRTYIQSLNSYYPFSYQKMNGVKFYENSASGSGELKPKPPEQPKPEPEIQADVVDIIEDSHVIDIGWNTAVGEESGANQGAQEEITENHDIEVIEENNLVEMTEDTALEEESGANQGPQEEITENHDIEVIEENNLVEMTEDTALGEESGANQGPQEEITENHDIEVIEENNLVEMTEDTAVGEESGANQGAQEEITENHDIEVIEENNLVEMTEDTALEEESGANQGAQEEITENHDIEVIEENNLVEMTEDTAVGEESGANQGAQEEITENHDIEVIEENNLVEMTEDTALEEESGANPGPQEEITENHDIEVIEENNLVEMTEDTAVGEESGANQGPQEEITENHDIEVIEENNLVEMTEDTAVGEESGANPGPQEEVTENQPQQEEIMENQEVEKKGDSNLVESTKTPKAEESVSVQPTLEDKNTKNHVNTVIVNTKVSEVKEKNPHHTKALPDTGTTSRSHSMMIPLLLVAGSVVLLRRKKKHSKVN